MTPLADLSEMQIRRYARHIVLAEIGGVGQAGVLGALAGTVGTLQATEVVKEILGIGRTLSGRLLMYDALAGTFDEMAVAKRPDCPTCGTS